MAPVLEDPIQADTVRRQSEAWQIRKPKWAKESIRSLMREQLGAEPPAGAEDRVLEFIGTDESPDRYNSVIRSDGWMLDRFRQNPVFIWCHDDRNLPVGRVLQVSVDKASKALKFLVAFPDAETYQFANTVFCMFQGGFLNAVSVGFWPHEVREVENEAEARTLGLAWPYLTTPNYPPVVYERQELLELSAVPVPGNPNALLQRAFAAFERGDIQGAGLDAIRNISTREHSQVMVPSKDWLNLRRAASLINGVLANGVPNTPMDQPAEPAPDAAPVEGAKAPQSDAISLVAARLAKEIMAGKTAKALAEADPIRWNRNLSRAFDVTTAELEPASVLYGWAAKYLGCEVSQIYMTSQMVPAARMGGFLAGLKDATRDYRLDAVRNIDSSQESPPLHEVVQLNSKTSDTFLVQGQAFYQADFGKVMLVFQPCWWGLDVTLMAKDDHREQASDVIGRAWTWLRENDPLRGEAFSLSGEFLTRGDAGLDGVFLPARAAEACKRTLEVLNRKGGQFSNRGMIMSGPPGTGKTTAARAFMNKAAATFIWVSSRDFHRLGSCTGFGYAFELARDLAPSVLVFEDIDNWITPNTVDLLKTEMDGIAQSRGVLTILTTNFPEQLPDALLDRPGRFHDVLEFGIPDATVRAAMVSAWMPSLTAEQSLKAVEAMDGFSGAHVREMANFVMSLVESDGVPVDEALDRAIQSIREQRELIERIQLEQGRYVPAEVVARSIPLAKFEKPASTQEHVTNVNVEIRSGLNVIELRDVVTKLAGAKQRDGNLTMPATAWDGVMKCASMLAQACLDADAACCGEPTDQPSPEDTPSDQPAPAAPPPAKAAPEVIDPALDALMLRLDGACERVAVAFEKDKLAPEDQAWDADAAKARVLAWAGGDKPDMAKYRKAFAWYDADKPENVGSYSMPHHDVQNGELVTVWKGVVAAMTALLGGRGGVDIPEADREATHKHLASHYREWGKEPPNLHD